MNLGSFIDGIQATTLVILAFTMWRVLRRVDALEEMIEEEEEKEDDYETTKD